MHIWLLLQKKGIHNVEWRYALPGSIDNKEIIVKLWENHIQPFLKAITTGEMSFSEDSYSESIAASMYFLSYKYSQDINRRQGYLVVDIGGGSTDIALWKKDDGKMQMVAHTSIPVAGRALFTRFIALNLSRIIGTTQNSELEEKLRYVNENSEWAKENQDASQKLVMYNSLLEQIIQSNLSIIQDAYICDAEWAPDLRRQMEFGIAMLFFSLGSLVGQKLAENVLPSNNSEGSFTIAVGGYGSKILNWLEGSEGKLLGMFQDGVRVQYQSGMGCQMNLIKSDQPKKEIALGLVQDEIETSAAKGCSDMRQVELPEALKLNESFADSYTRNFSKIDPIQQEKIHNLMDNGLHVTDVCSFLMQSLYQCYDKD